MTKTIKQWLCELPQPYKKQALQNTTAEKKKLRVDSLYDAVCDGFTWSGTPEGSDYWSSIHRNIERGRPITHTSRY